MLNICMSISANPARIADLKENEAAASLVTALVPSQMCSPKSNLSAMACTSAKVLQAFTWLFAVISEESFELYMCALS